MASSASDRSVGRTWGIRVLLVVGAVLAGLGLVAGHVNRHVLDGPTFADHVDELRRDDDVATQVGRAISTQVIVSNPDLVALRPLVEALSIRVAGGDVLSVPVRRSAAVAHTALTEPGADLVVLQVADAAAVVTGVLAALAPDRAPTVTVAPVTLASIGDQAFADVTIAVSRVVGVLAWLLPLLAVACLAGAVLLARDRWWTAVLVGRALLAAALVVGVVLVVGGFLVRRLDTDTLGGAVGRAGWQVFVQPLWWGVVALSAVGVALVLTCGSAAPGALRAQGERARAVLTRRPATPLGVAVRAVVVGAIGVAAIADPADITELLAFVVGVGLTLFALTELAILADEARTRRAAASADTEAGDGHRPIVLVAGGVVLALAAVGSSCSPGPGGMSTSTRSPKATGGATVTPSCASGRSTKSPTSRRTTRCRS